MAASVHHEAAITFLTELAAHPQTVETFKAQLSERYPGWQSNASPMQGYSTVHHHESLIVGRSVHDALPAPYNALPYQWDQKHGFGGVIAYVDLPGRKESDVDALLLAAADELKRVIGDSGGEVVEAKTKKK
ncbi:MAG: hypothetical protein AB7I42_24855 [Bradyrhizobium sp.]|uniref:hypothetical protein n=1 Tax=Bradyrhizobium sp. TaxID=376 RepID=UPI003D114331